MSLLPSRDNATTNTESNDPGFPLSRECHIGGVEGYRHTGNKNKKQWKARTVGGNALSRPGRCCIRAGEKAEIH